MQPAHERPIPKPASITLCKSVGDVSFNTYSIPKGRVHETVLPIFEMSL